MVTQLYIIFIESYLTLFFNSKFLHLWTLFTECHSTLTFNSKATQLWVFFTKKSLNHRGFTYKVTQLVAICKIYIVFQENRPLTSDYSSESMHNMPCMICTLNAHSRTYKNLANLGSFVLLFSKLDNHLRITCKCLLEPHLFIE